MTKTLTEQWKSGELPAGLYYFRKTDGLIYIEFHDDYRGFCTPEEYTKEVLDPVPSYEKYVELLEKIEQLEKKLDIAVKALEWYDGLENLLIGWEICTGQPKGTAQEALKQIKEKRND